MVVRTDLKTGAKERNRYCLWARRRNKAHAWDIGDFYRPSSPNDTLGIHRAALLVDPSRRKIPPRRRQDKKTSSNHIPVVSDRVNHPWKASFPGLHSESGDALRLGIASTQQDGAVPAGHWLRSSWMRCRGEIVRIQNASRAPLPKSGGCIRAAKERFRY
jgi:hypothetical protein